MCRVYLSAAVATAQKFTCRNLAVATAMRRHNTLCLACCGLAHPQNLEQTQQDVDTRDELFSDTPGIAAASQRESQVDGVRMRIPETSSIKIYYVTISNGKRHSCMYM